MFKSYLVEVKNAPVGILVREGDAYAFHALEPGLGDLEGAAFKDAFAAERAARRTLETRHKKG